ncbi:Mannosyltransferase (PIG-V)-like protein [Elsinoe fawcettii]|nr:Mannosyltransferase (PIG-V)-like protein [Elsinoe fawcettii]
MKTPNVPSRSADVRAILTLFVIWKSILLLVVALSPGPGYDTSSDLLLWDDNEALQARGLVPHLLLRLIRWDAVYFVNIANRGYLYEQEWAFGRGFMFLTGQLAKVLPESFLSSNILRQALSGSIIAHLSHASAVILLYELTFRALPGHTRDRTRIARLAACVHVITPAGVFLSAPYTESLFASLNFLGMLFLVLIPQNLESSTGKIRHLTCSVAAGVSFALATTVRSNGLLSVLTFVVLCFPAVLRILGGTINGHDLFALVSSGFGAVITTSGIVVPQYFAYRDYCTGLQQRSWCANIPPSIISFVQMHYWGNGFLAYWTLSNLPLFLIAAPTLILLFTTASAAMLGRVTLQTTSYSGSSEKDAILSPRNGSLVLRSLAAPQLLLSVLSATTFHVQIVNRISSGYPVWYIAIAACMTERQRLGPATSSGASTESALLNLLRGRERQQFLVTGFVLYAFVQAGLYSNFLPPA